MNATLDWYGCATFRLTVAGAGDARDTVVYLDAYIDRVPGAAGTGSTADDVDRADWILVGHSHFDHLWGAERIAANTGATVVGSYESIRIMAEQGVPAEQLMPVAGGERIRLSETVTASVFPSIHSCVWTHGRFADSGEVCLGDLGVVHQERLARLAERAGNRQANADSAMAEHRRAGDQGARGDGGALIYLLETPEGSLLYQDTSGHWSALLQTLRPDVAVLAAAGRGNVDGEPIQGSLADFVGRQASLLQPARLILGHHDDWLPGMTTATDLGPIRERLAEMAPTTKLVELDYLDGTPAFG